MEEHREETNSTEQPKKRNVNSGLISLELVARINKIDIDMRSVVREFGIETADTTPEEIMRIAKSRGFKIKKKNLTLKTYNDKYPLPALIQLKDETYVVLLALRPDENKVLIMRPLAKHPEALTYDELQPQMKDFILVLAHKLLDDVWIQMVLQ